MKKPLKHLGKETIVADKNHRQKTAGTLRFFLFTILLCLSVHLPLIYGAGFEPGSVRPKIITPNDDNKNDMLIVPYDNPNDSNVSGKILTLNGSFIADMLNDVTADRITWNGYADTGKTVPSGIYIYQIEAEGRVFNGTVIVAK